MKIASGLIAATLLITSCGGNLGSDGSITPLSAQQARRTSFPYAFSGQVLSAQNDAVLTDFSVDLIGADPAVNSVINPLGDRRGIFHISRSALKAENESVSLPVLITAKSHEPVVFYLEVKTDCYNIHCQGRPAHQLRLRTSVQTAREREASDDQFAPESSERAIRSVGANQIFAQLNGQQKFDPVLKQVLSQSKNGDQLTNILVVLNSSGQEEKEQLVSLLFSSATPPSSSIDFVKILSSLNVAAAELARISPELAVSLSSSKIILPYLKPLLDEMLKQGEGGTLGKILALSLKADSADRNLAAMGQILARAESNQLSMGGFLPYASEMTSAQAEGSVFGRLLYRSLVHENGEPTSQENVAQSLVLPYVRNLIQALGGRDGREIKQQLNSLLSRPNPLRALKEFPESPEEARAFGLLAPHLASLVEGLNGPYQAPLTHYLMPIINSRNPAQAMEELVQPSEMVRGASQGLLAELFPRCSEVWSEHIGQKQLFAAQLVQGTLRGQYQDAVVLKDMQGSPALLIAGQARDLFKIAQLPNVQKLIAISE